MIAQDVVFFIFGYPSFNTIRLTFLKIGFFCTGRYCIINAMNMKFGSLDTEREIELVKLLLPRYGKIRFCQKISFNL